MANSIAVRRNHEVFVVPETTSGTLATPSASNYVIPVGLAMLNQTPSFTDSGEIQNTRDVIDRFQDRMPPGEWSLSVYSRPSGSAGTAPQESDLMEGLFGTETVVGSTSVTYSQAMTKPSFSIWIKYDHMVRFAIGATVSDCSIAASNKGAAQMNFSGKCMQTGTVGTQDIASAVTGSDTAIEVDDASCYSVGGLIEFYDVSAGTTDDNSSSGYEITAVNTSTNTLTITPGAGGAFALDDLVRPFLPTGTEVGAPVENRKTTVSIGGSSMDVTSFEVSISDPAEYIEDEITDSDYVESYVENTRSISGSVGLLLRRNEAKWFEDNYSGQNLAVQLVQGDTAGSIVTHAMSKCSIEVPAVEDGGVTVRLKMNFKALGTSGEDSMTSAYT